MSEGKGRAASAWVLALLAVLPASPSLSGTLEKTSVQATRTAAGLQVLVKPSRAADLAAVQLWIRAGGYLETPETHGITHAIEHLLFRASSKKGEESIDAQVENLGGLLEATTEKDWIRLSCTVSGRHAARVVEIIGKALQEPGFTSQAYQAELPLMLEEIDSAAANPAIVVSDQVYRLAYRTHPYRLEVRGNPAVLRRLTVAQLEAHYARYFRPSNMVLLVAGNVDPSQISAAAARAFPAPASGAEPPQIPPDESPCSSGERKTEPSQFGAGFVGLAFPAPSVKDIPHTHAMDLILTMLDHKGQGRLSRLLQGGPVQATYQTRRQAGVLIVVAGTGAADPAPVEALIRKEIDFFRTQTVTQEDLELARRLLHGSYALDNETFEGQASSLGYYAAIEDWKFASEYLEKVGAVTPEQIHETARKYLDPATSVTLLMTPRANPPAGERR